MGKSFNHSHGNKTDIKVKKVGKKDRDNKQTFKLHNKKLSLQDLEDDGETEKI